MNEYGSAFGRTEINILNKRKIKNNKTRIDVKIAFSDVSRETRL